MADRYVATEVLETAPGVRAHNPGDEVPAENIDANGWRDRVAKAGTKAAERAAESREP